MIGLGSQLVSVQSTLGAGFALMASSSNSSHNLLNSESREHDQRAYEALLRGGPANDESIIIPNTLTAPAREFLLAGATNGPGGPRNPPRSDISGLSGKGGPPPPAGIYRLPRGGIMAQTSQGWVQFGVPMWTNKDARQLYLSQNGDELEPDQIPHIVPTVYVFDLDYVPDTDGLIPADFLQYMFFVTQGNSLTLLGQDEAMAARLRRYLDLAFKGPDDPNLSAQVRREYPVDAVGIPYDIRREMHEAFDDMQPEQLRSISALSETGEYQWGDLVIRKIGTMLYEIQDGENVIGPIDLDTHPIPARQSRITTVMIPETLKRLHQKVLVDKQPGIWPIGTGHGFSHDEETSGFVIWNKGRAIIVDPPSSTFEFLERNGLPLQAVDGVMLTHGHTDHYGNAIPRLLQTLPALNFYTTPTIYRMLQELYELSIGSGMPGLEQWRFVPLEPHTRQRILGLDFWFDYTLHTVPTLGFDIYKPDDSGRTQPIVMFTGDSFTDHDDIWKHAQPKNENEPPLLTRTRIEHLIRHINPLMTRSREKPPFILIDNGVRPLHPGTAKTRDMLERAEAMGIDTSRVRVYHVSGSIAAAGGVPKWQGDHRGFLDLSEYFDASV